MIRSPPLSRPSSPINKQQTDTCSENGDTTVQPVVITKAGKNFSIKRQLSETNYTNDPCLNKKFNSTQSSMTTNDELLQAYNKLKEELEIIRKENLALKQELQESRVACTRQHEKSIINYQSVVSADNDQNAEPVTDTTSRQSADDINMSDKSIDNQSPTSRKNMPPSIVVNSRKLK